jgi:hypothetical protein
MKLREERYIVHYNFSLRYGDMQLSAKSWIKRLGFWGFMFFLVKGLLWLIVPAVIAILALD